MRNTRNGNRRIRRLRRFVSGKEARYGKGDVIDAIEEFIEPYCAIELVEAIIIQIETAI